MEAKNASTSTPNMCKFENEIKFQLTSIHLTTSVDRYMNLAC